MSYYVANAGGSSYSGPFKSFDDARYHEDSGRRMADRLYGEPGSTGRAVTRSRRVLLLAGPGGRSASITADRRGLGHWSDSYEVVGQINYPREAVETTIRERCQSA